MGLTRFRTSFSNIRADGLKVYAAALALAAAGLFAATVITGTTLGAPVWVVALVAVIAFLAERQPVRITPNTEITVSVLPILFAAVVFGPVATMMIAAAAPLGDFGRPYTRWVVWTSLRVLAGGLASTVAVTILALGSSPGIHVAAVAGAAIAEAVVDLCLGAVVVALRRTGSWTDYMRSVRTVLLATIPLYTPVILLLSYAYAEISAWTVLLFFAPAFAAHRFYRLYQEQREAVHGLEEANVRLERANLSFATALVATLDARDKYTAGHSAAVAVYSRDIAARMGLSEQEQQLAHVAALVHDIGKVGLSPGLLEKEGPLTLDERRQMEKHAEIGERILANVEDYAEISAIVRHHHERVDGHGYPDGLSHGDIPLISRIIAVADAYDAMTSDRPYRDAMPSRVARIRLAQAVESQFDTSVVAAFEAILAGAPEHYRLGQRGDFNLPAQEAAARAARAG